MDVESDGTQLADQVPRDDIVNSLMFVDLRNLLMNYQSWTAGV